MTPDDDSDSHHIFSGKMNLQKMIEFVKPFALPENEKKTERIIVSKEKTSMKEQVDQSGYKVLTSSADMEEKVLRDQWAALVYVAEKD